MATETVKIVVVGDGGVGKTALLYSYTENKFKEDYLPTVFDNYSAGIDFNGRLLTLSLWDTAGQEEYARLRSLSYPETNIFFVCFDVTQEQSLENVKEIWHPEVTQHCPEAKILLIGTKADLRDNFSITEAAAKSMANYLGTRYCECSAKTQEGLHKVFETGLELTLQTLSGEGSGKKKRKCSLL